MASPITWRNVDAPDLSGTAQIMGQGNSALTNGLAALQQTAQDIGKTQIANFDNQTQRNTDSLVQQIRAAQNMDQLQQLTHFNDPQVLQQQYGAQINGDKVQQALLQQPTVMRTRQNGIDQFNDEQILKDFRQTLYAQPTAGAVLTQQLPQGMADPGKALSEKDQLFSNKNAQEQLIASQNKTQRMNSFNNVLMQALQNGTSLADLPATAQQAGVQLSLSPEEIGAGLESARGTYDKLTALTPEQQLTLKNATLPQQRSLEQLQQFIKQQEDNFNNNFAILKEYKQSDEQNVSVADAFASSKGWNATNTYFDGRDGATGAELREMILDDLAKYEKEQKRPVSGWVIKRALDTVGDNGEGFWNHDHQISTNQFMKLVKKIDSDLRSAQNEEQAFIGEQNMRKASATKAQDAFNADSENLKLLIQRYNLARNQGNTAEMLKIEGMMQNIQKRLSTPFTLQNYSQTK